ncbi:MAG: glutamate racemase [Antricoccus sp.]
MNSSATQFGRCALPIGVFDSGVGGLTVARSIIDQLPYEEVRYLGDTEHVPYGPRPIAQIRQYALACLDRLVADGVKALVIACNSASAACLRDARERYDVPVIEVIAPAVRRAVAASANHRIGVIGTAATIDSHAYVDAFAAAPHVNLIGVACPEFVEYVEQGITSGREIIGLARKYLQPLIDDDIDTLILGCTHYPMLIGAISVVMGDGVTLINSADETAKDVYQALTRLDLLRADHHQRRHQFLATGDPEPFAVMGRRFLGALVDEIPAVEQTGTIPVIR